MMTKTLIIKQLIRSPQTGDYDELNFELGVNVVVGEPNTGKTQWLRMLNYLMGDRDGEPSNAFDSDLAEKYSTLRGVFSIDGEEIILERRWKESGSKTKIFINDESISANDFSSYLLSQLNIPILHYPQGNPLSKRTWPSLSWQSLLRHIYRKQKSWGELASQQLEVEQHACLLLFLGLAEHLFSSEYEQLIEKQKAIYLKQASKDNFVQTLNQISRELLDDAELGVAITPESLASALSRLERETVELINRRSEILATVQEAALNSTDELKSASNEFEKLGQRWAELQFGRTEIATQIKTTQTRLGELRDYSSKLQEELSRVGRARSAGQVFRDLRVNKCPACGQPVKVSSLPDHCYLCGQESKVDDHQVQASEQRLDFEIEQLQEEHKEAEELIEMVTRNLSNLFLQQRSMSEELARLESQMRPLQSAAAIVMPPEISQLDMELGRQQERRRQLERIQGTLDFQANLAQEIDQLEHEIRSLEAEVAQTSSQINYEQASSLIAQQMNTYLNMIHQRNPNSWTQGDVAFRISERGFKFTVGGNKLNSLGATMMMYFWAAYNYALLSLSRQGSYHYPGLLILEFPATLGGSSVKDKENFVVEPFIELIQKPEMLSTQVIAVGNAFQGLEGVHRIELSHVWK